MLGWLPDQRSFARLHTIHKPARRVDVNGDGPALSMDPSWMDVAEKRELREQFVPEDEWASCQTWIFFPSDPRKKLWDSLMLLCVLYSMVMVPYELAFDSGDVDLVPELMEKAVLLVFVLDLLAHFNTAYLVESHGTWCVSRRSIAAKYIRSWFVLDALASIPFVEIYALISHHLELVHEVNTEWLLRTLRIFRLRRLLPEIMNEQFQWPQLIRRAEEASGLDLTALGVMNVLLAVLAFVHLIGCLFYALAVSEYRVHGDSWIAHYRDGAMLLGNEANDDEEEEHRWSHFERYMAACTYAMGLVTGLNSEIFPATHSERLLSNVCYLISALFFSFMIAVVQNKLSLYVNHPATIRMEELNDFCRFHHVDSQLEKELQRYQEFRHAHMLATDVAQEGRLLDTLTPSLRHRVMTCVLKDNVESIPLFSTCLKPRSESGDFLRNFKEKIYEALKLESYLRNEVILRKGSWVQTLYFVCKGSVMATSEHPSYPGLLYSLSRGDFFGEGALTEPPCSALDTYKARERCTVWSISVVELIELADAELDTLQRRELVVGLLTERSKKCKMRVEGFGHILKQCSLGENEREHLDAPTFDAPTAAALPAPAASKESVSKEESFINESFRAGDSMRGADLYSTRDDHHSTRAESSSHPGRASFGRVAEEDHLQRLALRVQLQMYFKPQARRLAARLEPERRKHRRTKGMSRGGRRTSVTAGGGGVKVALFSEIMAEFDLFESGEAGDAAGGPGRRASRSEVDLRRLSRVGTSADGMSSPPPPGSAGPIKVRRHSGVDAAGLLASRIDELNAKVDARFSTLAAKVDSLVTTLQAAGGASARTLKQRV